MVDYSSLENYRTERYRGFESLSLRTKKMSNPNGLLFFLRCERGCLTRRSGVLSVASLCESGLRPITNPSL